MAGAGADQELYARIAKNLAAVAPVGWTRLVVSGGVLQDWAALSYFAVDGEGREDRFTPPLNVDLDTVDCLQALQQLMRNTNQPEWNAVRFEFSQSGGFKLNFDYAGERAP